MLLRHQLLLGGLLLGNAVLFAGVDPVTRLVSAAVALLMVADMRRLPRVPRAHVLAGAVLAGLVAVQLLPLPAALRSLVQPGFAEVMHSGWAPLSLAPWATLEAAAYAVVMVAVALTAARMARTRSGMPTLLMILAGTGVLVALLGLIGEAGAPDKVLLVRDNTGRGGVYGPFVNSNHFALAIELTVPAALVLLAAASRHIRATGPERARGTVTILATGVAIAVAVGALLRSGSRGGATFLVLAGLATALWWRRRRRRAGGGVLPLLLVGVTILVVLLAWTRLPVLDEGMRDLVMVEGLEGQSRLDFWAGTVASFWRSPLVGSGLGSYPHVIGMDKPATGTLELRTAHNDWLEILATGGAAAAGALLLLLIGLAGPLDPGRTRRRRFEYRYALAGAAFALVAAALHELVGSGLQTPLNGYLAASWLGIVWGIEERVGRRREQHREARQPAEDSVGDLTQPEREDEANHG